MAVENGDIVRVEYIGRFQESGDVFDTSREDVAEEEDILNNDRQYQPLEFTAGSGEVVEGFDEGVIGMEVGSSKEIVVPPEKGYGEHSDDMIREYDREEFNEVIGQDAEVGMHIHTENAHGDVVEVGDESVSVDFNHELAGETLVFEVELLDIE